jgi:cytochrome c oxidase subunit 1
VVGTRQLAKEDLCHLPGRALPDVRLARARRWLRFVGMIVTIFPWHWVGILGMPRRMAYFDLHVVGSAPSGH